MCWDRMKTLSADQGRNGCVMSSLIICCWQILTIQHSTYIVLLLIHTYLSSLHTYLSSTHTNLSLPTLTFHYLHSPFIRHALTFHHHTRFPKHTLTFRHRTLAFYYLNSPYIVSHSPTFHNPHSPLVIRHSPSVIAHQPFSPNSPFTPTHL